MAKRTIFSRSRSLIGIAGRLPFNVPNGARRLTESSVPSPGFSGSLIAIERLASKSSSHLRPPMRTLSVGPAPTDPNRDRLPAIVFDTAGKVASDYFEGRIIRAWVAAEVYPLAPVRQGIGGSLFRRRSP